MSRFIYVSAVHFCLFKCVLTVQKGPIVISDEGEPLASQCCLPGFLGQPQLLPAPSSGTVAKAVLPPRSVWNR